MLNIILSLEWARAEICDVLWQYYTQLWFMEVVLVYFLSIVKAKEV